jgi:hypothetical protein
VAIGTTGSAQGRTSRPIAFAVSARGSVVY